MASGYFILSVRKAGNVSFGILETGQTSQRAKYDDNSREKRQRRDATLEFMKGCRDRWADQHMFRDASFRIEEVDTETGEVRVIAGVPHEAPEAQIPLKDIRQNLVDLATKATKRFKKDATMLSNYLFVEADRTDVAGWRQISVYERVELVREVAAGFFTAAVQG